YQFEVKDCKKPTVVCNSNLAVKIKPTSQITLWASDFVQILDDNATPASLIVLAIRKASTGTGFPVDSAGNPQHSVTFDCNELGNQPIELWAKDLAGNTDYCETYVNVQDNAGICAASSVNFNIELCADTWCTNTPVSGVDWGIFIPNLQTGIPLSGINPAGCLELDSAFHIFPASVYYFYPDKNNDPLNGVDVLDIIKTAQHILGVTPLASPYAMVAADVNKSSSITAFDMVETLKLLAGIYTEFPNNNSWRFIPKTFVFPNPNNPFISQYPAGVELVNAQGLVEGNAEFWAVKVGDVDCSSFPGLTAGADDRSVRLLQAPDRELQAGETFDWPVYPTEAANWLGFQLELLADPARMQVDGWAPGSLPNWQESTILQASPGQINAVWYDVTPASLAAHQPLFVLRLKALQRLRLSEALSLNTRRIPAKVYDSEVSSAALQLRFEPGLNATPVVGEPWPNPSASGFSLAVQAPENTPVDLDVLDLQGRLIWQYRSDTGGTLHIPADIFPASGAYLWRVRTGGTEQSGKLMVREK
ncbi:MAG: T9SS type A sorting domain-containing protein, partial [Saprospiraceae bacterium]|nr:T9SS type A sorting domain-containing protein [Saprospiraceae bacterium]